MPRRDNEDFSDHVGAIYLVMALAFIACVLIGI
jgi:hypothetical protein